MRRLVLAAIMVATPLVASPRPPPPPWVMAAGEVLATSDRGDEAKAAPLFADDVTVAQNGVTVAHGKPAWLAWRAKERGYQDNVLGLGEGWSRDGKGGGELMVLDSFEDFDRSTLAPTMLVDPRRRTRSTLYRFGDDHLIHNVEVSRVEGFLMRPSAPTAKPPA